MTTATKQMTILNMAQPILHIDGEQEYINLLIKKEYVNINIKKEYINLLMKKEYVNITIKTKYHCEHMLCRISRA